MIKSLKIAVAAAAALGGASLASGTASAMPIGLDNATAAATTAGKVENVRFVCGPFRCFYRPGFYRPFYRPFFGFYPRRFYGGYGFYRRRFFY